MSPYIGNLRPIRIKGPLTFASPSQAERQTLAGAGTQCLRRSERDDPDHCRICTCSFVLTSAASPPATTGSPETSSPQPASLKLIRQTAVVVEREPDCPRRFFDRGGAAAFCRRHQSRGRGFPLRAMSRPGQRDNERAGVTQRMKSRPIRQRDRAGELACPFWFPPKRHGGQAAPNCWLAFASLAGLLRNKTEHIQEREVWQHAAQLLLDAAEDAGRMARQV